ncbi:anhydro-N-acetylmuramic acid kinase [Pseudoalteromonas sp. SMS1]|uniref:anhydro-N-acetylmuramic acid kinase n=1 Tax=Pseudoalteromonas sp. SMS1 TaxID=2908894 RepID=UPI001F269F5C|nr:anhydro-N-acetylmuramic acid kinase [Pseudoalteromonas sp. SMS1]MCF2855848.1 anhydro-N-acetylmuramic acid kinase [Pseudoalteromonas sp. SMS1]
MNPYIHALHSIAKKPTRIILGLMSGTSLDGLDLALCKISGSGKNTRCEVLKFNTIAYQQDCKDKIMSVFAKDTVNLQYLTLLNPWIGELHASMINQQLVEWGVDKTAVDLIASHGQTIYHSPKHFHNYPEFNNATLQLGDGDHIAVNTGIITISDFRQKHIAAGFEGAPLAQYGDFFLFSSKSRNTVLLNIGGIANFTYMKKGATINEIVCSDIGPGNTMMDQYVKKYFDKNFDQDGNIAAKGKVVKPLLDTLLGNDFIAQPLPKTTGPELFNLALLEHCIDSCSELVAINHSDIMATLNQFTAEVIAQHIKQLKVEDNLHIFVSGGGAHNTTLLNNLSNLLYDTVEIETLDMNGINADSKEAVLFAVLANECIAADKPKHNESGLTLGKLSLPL